MFHLMRKIVIAGALSVPFLFVMPDSASADPGRRGHRDGYWDNYWGWYDRDYRPYYNRRFHRGYNRGYYPRGQYYYYDDDFGFSYNPYRNRYYGNRYYRGYRGGNALGIGPLQFYWR